MVKRIALLHLHSIDDEALWRAALASQNVPTASVPRTGAGIIDMIRKDARLADAGVLIVDVPILISEGISAPQFAARLKRSNPHLAVFLRLPQRPRISAQEQAWARSSGISGVLPGTSFSFWRETIVPALAQVLLAMDRDVVQVERIGDFLKVLVDQQSNAIVESVERAFQAAERIS